MKYFKIAILFIIFLFIIFQAQSLQAQNPSTIRNSLVRIFVHKQELEIYEPWKQGRVFTEEHIGTVVEFNNKNEKGVLIKASALNNVKRIEMELLTDSHLIEMSPVFIDREVNLALLETVSSEALESLHPITVYDNELPLEEEAHLFRIENNRNIVRIPSSLRKVTFGERSDVSSYPIINYMFKFTRKELGWSEPILSKGRLVALSVGQDEEDNVHAIPSSLIQHFLNDNLNEGYHGFPNLGLEYSRLSSSYKREALGLEKIKNGVQITKIHKSSPFYTLLKKGDILMSINGIDINYMGNINHPLWGEISFEALLYKHYSGENITLQILRDQKSQKLTGELTRYYSNQTLIPYFSEKDPIPYIIVGGLVFQELTRTFLRSWGPNWLGDAPSYLTYLWKYKNNNTKDPKERVIILNQVLSDPINKGYESIGNAVVKSVNGNIIHSLEDLKLALAKPIRKRSSEFQYITLDYGEGDIILPLPSLKEANSRIASNYGIYSHAFFPTIP